MKREELEQWAIHHHFIKDKFGHYQKTLSNGTVIRFKMQSNSVRYEEQVKIVDHNEWLKVKSGYYKNLSFTADDKLSGLK